jgi:hypothetical protein
MLLSMSDYSTGISSWENLNKLSTYHGLPPYPKLSGRALEMRLPTYASGSGGFSVRDAAVQDDTSGIGTVRSGDVARE